MKFFLTTLVLILSLNYSLACSCSRVGILEGQKDAEFVFTGKVLEINKIVTNEKVTGSKLEKEYTKYEFVFKIKSIHKGKKRFNFGDTVSIITTGGESDCGSYFNLNKRYLVYSYQEHNKIGRGLQDQKANESFMSTHLCTRTRKVGFFTFLEQLILELT